MLKVDVHNEDYKGKQMTSCTVEVDGDLLQVCEDLRRVVGGLFTPTSSSRCLCRLLFSNLSCRPA